MNHATDIIEDEAIHRVIDAIKDAAPEGEPRAIRIKQHGGPIWITRASGRRAALDLAASAGQRTHDAAGMPLPADERVHVDLVALHRALRDALPAAFPHSRVAVAVFW